MNITHIIGANAGDRFGIWANNGDLTGDNVDDIAVSADLADNNSQTNSGAVYVLRSGRNLVGMEAVDLVNFGTASAVAC